ncbi:acidic proline-rich protein PRP25-like [Choloepus didactylus]|uniref:acidic proline-rich protein PRP25-like n=1 Tax=Choloepus didactylus TaxID=27675 RepID=UPI00189FD595|nr:acidic proline-rich protein PRP25-like [Choloepus didactylus]
MVDVSPGTVPPQPGTPATPAGGWRQQPPPSRPQPQPPVKGSEEGETQPGLARKERAGEEPRSRGGASLRDAAKRKQRSARWGRAGRCRAQAPGGGGVVLPEPSPPSPASPPTARSVLGDDRVPPQELAERSDGPAAAADSSRHAPVCTPPKPGGGGGGERVRRGEGQPMAPHLGRAKRKAGGPLGAGSQKAAGERREQPRFPSQPMPTSSSAGQLLTPVGGES